MSTAYQAGAEGGEFIYPHIDKRWPEPGAKVSLLTKGGIHTTGPWDASFCVAWLPLPKRNKDKEDAKTKTA